MIKLADLRYRIFAADEYDRFVDVIVKGKFFAAQAAAKAMTLGVAARLCRQVPCGASRRFGATPSAPYSAAKAALL
jgi:NAD(P)-dependent dehydrogenase (short-subunit alcohol dehydrogenase family)